MKRIGGLHFMINIAAATALSTPLIGRKEPDRTKGPAEPHTPKEIQQAQSAARCSGMRPVHPNVPSLKAVQKLGPKGNGKGRGGRVFKR